MSASDQKLPRPFQYLASALPSKADIAISEQRARFGPTADIPGQEFNAR
jgi:hypothetical protein